MIYQGSRYASATVVPVSDAAGNYFSAVLPPSGLAPITRYTMYQVVFGDRLDTIAAAALGDSELWWRVAQANPELVYPDVLVPGTFIRVPMAVGL